MILIHKPKQTLSKIFKQTFMSSQGLKVQLELPYRNSINGIANPESHTQYKIFNKVNHKMCKENLLNFK